ncbi:hypothetical protein ACFE04_030828 [Oxalis oulophora]
MSFIENENDENYKEQNMDNEIEMETINNTEECLVSLLRIGLSCSDTEPSMRMPKDTLRYFADNKNPFEYSLDSRCVADNKNLLEYKLEKNTDLKLEVPSVDHC